MATYQDSPAYQTYQTNPYTLPTQQIVQAIQNRNSYWDSAASNLRNSYQNFLGLQLSNPANKEKLNGLMDGVTKDLQSATKTDLSLGENYGHALSIFDPITKDDNIMGDNAITKEGVSQMQTGMQQRTTNGGKDYNSASMQEIQNHLSDFSKADPNNWRQFYNTRPVYTPYTDYMAEKRTADRNFKPDTTDFTTPVYVDANGKPTNDWKNGTMSPYLLNTHDKSIVASQYRAYLDANLSDKAKGQIAMEGRVKYHDNPDALANDYGNIMDHQVNSNKLQIEDLKGKIPTATPAQQEVLQDQIRRLSGDNDQKTLQMSKIKAGDYSEITPYKDGIAGFVHTNNTIGYMADASAHKDITVKYSESGLYKDLANQAFEDARQKRALEATATQGNLNRANRLQTTMLKLGMTASGKSVLPITGAENYQVNTGDSDQHYSSDIISKMKTDSEADYTKAQNTLTQYVRDANGTESYDKMSPEAQKSAEQAWMNDPKNQYYVDQFKASAEKKTLNDKYFQAIDDFTNQQIKEKNPDVYNSKENTLKSVPTQGETLNVSEEGAQNYHPLKLSGDDIKSVLNGTNPNMKLVTVQKHEGSHGPDDPGNDYNQTYLQINGKNYEFGNSILRNSYNKLNEGDRNYNEEKDKILNQNVTSITGVHQFIGDPEKNPTAKAIYQTVQGAMMGGKAGDITTKDFNVVATDNDGGVYVKLQGKPGIEPDEVAKNISQNNPGGAAARYIKATNTFYLPGNLFGSLTKAPAYQDQRLDIANKYVSFRGQVKTGGSEDLPPMKFGDRDFHIKVMYDNGHPTFQVVDGDRGAVFSSDLKTGAPFQSIEDAASFANQLGNKTVTPDDVYNGLVKNVGHGN